MVLACQYERLFLHRDRIRAPTNPGDGLLLAQLRHRMAQSLAFSCPFVGFSPARFFLGSWLMSEKPQYCSSLILNLWRIFFFCQDGISRTYEQDHGSSCTRAKRRGRGWCSLVSQMYTGTVVARLGSQKLPFCPKHERGITTYKRYKIQENYNR